MRFHVLGPIAVLDNDGQSLRVGGPMQRTVLAVLLASSGERVASDRMVAALYGEDADQRSKRTVQTYISNLRKTLGGDLIETVGGGWSLRLGSHDLDSQLFEESYRAVFRGDLPVETRSRELRSALNLWDGEPYESVDSHGALEGERTRLAELRLAALGDLMDAELELDPHQAIAQLEALMAEYPYNERFRGQHMLALYRAGRQREALASYSRFRRYLAEGLGVSPSPSLQALEDQILVHDPSLNIKDNLAGSAEISSRPGHEPANNLGTQLGRFVGRDRELWDVAAILEKHRMVTFTGAGGSGKTRLALEAAREAMRGFPDGVWFVDLTPLRDPHLVPSQIANSIGAEQSDQSDMDSILESVAGQRALILLDNCEHLLPYASSVTAEILRAGPDIVVLATSREPLKVPGEFIYRVPPMSTPPEGTEIGNLRAFDAVRLFEDRAALIQGWTATSELLEDVAALCRRLDGLPLAIELAAARMGSLSPRTMLEGLDTTYSVLGSGSSTRPKHQRTLEATMQWSYQLLDPVQQRLLNRLSVFAGFDVQTARSICGFDPIAGESISDLLASLVEKSLVRAEQAGHVFRYHLPEAVRSYALRELEKSGEGDRTRRRHAEYFMELTEKAKRDGGLFQRLDQEHDNLRAAMTWALHDGDPAMAQLLIGHLYGYYLGSYRAREGLEWAERALGASAAPTSERAWALLAAGSLGNDAHHLDEAIALSRSTDNNAVLANALQNRAFLAAEEGQWERADQLYQELAQTQPDGRLSGRAGVVFLMLSSERALDRGDHPTAVTRAKEALKVAEGSTRLEDLARLSLVNAYRVAGQLDRAEAVLQPVFEKNVTVASGYHLGLYEIQKSVLAKLRNEPRAAVQLYHQAVNRILDVPDPANDGRITDWILWRGAELLHMLDQSDTAAQIMGAADAYLESVGQIRPKWEADETDSVIDEIRDALDEDSFQRRYREGSQMQPDQVLERLSAELGEALIPPK